MKKEFSFLICGVLIGALLATCGFSIYLRSMKTGGSEGASEQMVLKLGHSLDTNHPVHLGMVYMNERLQELSGGKVRIDIYSSSVLGSEVECLEQIRDGSLDMTKSSAASIENFVPEMAVFGLPYLFSDEDHYWAVLNGQVGKELLQKGNDKKIMGLCYYDAGSRNFYTIDRPIVTPDDLKGLKIRVMNSQTAIDMVTALGASATPIAWGELYTALTTGTVDGAENNFPSFSTNKHYEVCKHFSLDGHTRIPDMLLMGTNTWNRLSLQVQAWVQQAANESSEYQRQLWREKTEEAMRIAQENGVEVYEVDQSLFAQKVQPMYDKLEDERIKDLVRRIREVKP